MTTKEIILDLIKDNSFTEEYKNDLINKIENSRFGFSEGHPTHNKYFVIQRLVEYHIKETMKIEKEYRFKIQYDDSPSDFVYELGEILKPYGIKLEIEDEEHDGFEICIVKIEK